MCMSVKLGCNSRLEAVDDFFKFTTEDRPAVAISRWNMTQNVNLKMNVIYFFLERRKEAGRPLEKVTF